jgi:drug/metabolite transporter (DMT)-like permease
MLVLFLSREWHARGRLLKIRQWRLGLIRGLFIAGAQFCFYLSITKMELATASTLTYISPVLITMLSIPILKHQVGLWRWIAVFIGFVGVLMIMAPGSEVFTPYSLLPIGASLGYSLYLQVESAQDWLLLIAMGFVGGFAVLALINAYRLTRPANLSPYEYFGIPFAFVLGWIFFDEAPFEKLIPGVFLIVMGGMLIAWRERRKRIDAAPVITE